MKLIKSSSFYLFYYIILLLVFISWQNYDSVPGRALRIAYLAAVVLPLYVAKIEMFPAVVALFYTIAMSGFTTSYMPARDYTYIAVTAIAVVIAARKHCHQKLEPCLVWLFALSSLVNMMTSSGWQNISSAILLLILFFLIVDRDYVGQSKLFAYSLIVSSLILSMYFLIVGPRFIMEYRTMEGLDRIGFTDINYGGTIVGMGVFAAFVELLSKKNLPSLNRIVIWLTIALSIFSLVMNASRGAVLSIIVASAILVLFSKTKTIYKVFIIVLLALFVAFLYTKGYMDLLLYRVGNDELGGGSGRTDIWKIKLETFITEASPFEWVLGMGYTGGRHLGWGAEQRAFHNDFLAFFVDYGLIGLFSFLYFFFKPLKNLKINKSFIFAGMAFLFVACMTLEPFTAGRLPFFVFWFYLIQLSKSNWLALEGPR